MVETLTGKSEDHSQSAASKPTATY